ncbi:unnamed protein product [Periconia digitata]|uniref:Uncharacterized protein n=1 Tax=Periconia digitata TaxID=1303443 RepID=A0A9W4U8P9_9PLEO|nr:unnamed protein product [Periconia digitata]
MHFFLLDRTFFSSKSFACFTLNPTPPSLIQLAAFNERGFPSCYELFPKLFSFLLRW